MQFWFDHRLQLEWIGIAGNEKYETRRPSDTENWKKNFPRKIHLGVEVVGKRRGYYTYRH